MPLSSPATWPLRRTWISRGFIKAGVFRRHDGLAQFHAFLPCHHRVAHWPLHKYDGPCCLLLPGLHGRLHRLFLAGYVGLPGFQLRFFLADTTRAGQDRKQYAKETAQSAWSTTGLRLPKHVDAVRHRCRHEAQTFHRAARLAGQANHQRFVHHRGQVRDKIAL